MVRQPAPASRIGVACVLALVFVVAGCAPYGPPRIGAATTAHDVGRVTGSAQVLIESNFDAVRPGTTSDALLRPLGRPSERQRAAWHNEIWSYRHDVVDCRWYRVALGPDAHVLSSGWGPDPLCTPRE